MDIENLKKIIGHAKTEKTYWSIFQPLEKYIADSTNKKEVISDILHGLIESNTTVPDCSVNLVIICTISKYIYWYNDRCKEEHSVDKEVVQDLWHTFSNKLSTIAEKIKAYGSSLDKTIELLNVFNLLEAELEVGGSDIVWIPFETSYDTVNTDFINWLFEDYDDFLFKVNTLIELSIFRPEDMRFDESLKCVTTIYLNDIKKLDMVNNLPEINF